MKAGNPKKDSNGAIISKSNKAEMAAPIPSIRKTLSGLKICFIPTINQRIIRKFKLSNVFFKKQRLKKTRPFKSKFRKLTLLLYVQQQIDPFEYSKDSHTIL